MITALAFPVFIISGCIAQKRALFIAVLLVNIGHHE